MLYLLNVGINWNDGRLNSAFSGFLSPTWFFMYVILNTYYVMHKKHKYRHQLSAHRLGDSSACNNDINPLYEYQLNKSYHCCQLINIQDNTMKSIIPDVGNGTISPYTYLTNIIKDKDGFDLFIKHLISEMSHENLLFLVESSQFRKYYEPLLHVNKDDNNNVKKSEEASEARKKCNYLLTLEFPENIPKSPIFDMTTMQEQILFIYNKYVCNSTAAYLINISYRCRLAVDNKVSEMEKNKNNNENTKYVDIFDDAGTQIFCLLFDSFSRFTITSEYKSWLQKR